jgi:membrane protease YdiL (CAAX protease family)
VAWVGVSAAAALGEELVFRGVTVTLLSQLFGNWLFAAVVTSIAFGLAHAVQGWVNSFHVALFGMAFHLLVLATGDLWMAMAVHFVYDVVTGFYLGSRTTTQ